MIDQITRLYIHFKRRIVLEKLHKYRKTKIVSQVDPTLAITVFYRVSDAGFPKNKPAYINNENCLRNAVLRFPLNTHKWVLIADNCSEPTMEMIRKYLPQESIIQASVGHGAGTFRMTLDMALKMDDNEIAYFLENDYLHRDGASQALREGLELFDYATLYDHPDKYGNDCFLIKNGGEKSRVLLSESCHWKVTAATTMTFAAKALTLKKDKRIIYRWTATRFPFDCEMFMNLARKKHYLGSPIPSYSTHGEVAYLAVHVDWTAEATKTE